MLVGLLSTGVIRTPGDNRPLPDLYQDAIERAMLLDDLGFDFLQLGEHHFMENQWNPAPLMLLASIASRTSRLRLGTNVLLTPLYNPVRLAEDVAVLDQISRGRVELVCGSASITGEFETFNVDPSERFGRVWETMSILRRAFEQDRFDHHGRYFHHPNVRLTTKPVQRPFPLWFGGFGPKMITRAAREGYHFFGTRNADVYTEALRQAGRNPDDFNLGMAVNRVVLVASERDIPEARERAQSAAAAHNAEYNETGRDLAFQFIASTASRQEPLVGTPEGILTALEPRFKSSNVTHLQSGVGGSERPILELFAREVLPTLKTWGRSPVEGHERAKF